MPGVCSGGLFGKKFGRVGENCDSWGGLCRQGVPAHPAALSSLDGTPLRLGSDVTRRAAVCREIDFGEFLIALPCKIK